MWPLCDFEMSQKYVTKQKNFLCYWNWIFSTNYLRNTIFNSIMHCTVDCRGKKGSHLSLITYPIEMHIKMNLLKNCTGWSIMASEGLPFSIFKTIPVLCDNYFSVKYLNMDPVLSHFFGSFINKKIKQIDMT